jgi:hypothetical protein
MLASIGHTAGHAQALTQWSYQPQTIAYSTACRDNTKKTRPKKINSWTVLLSITTGTGTVVPMIVSNPQWFASKPTEHIAPHMVLPVIWLTFNYMPVKGTNCNNTGTVVPGQWIKPPSNTRQQNGWMQKSNVPVATSMKLSLGVGCPSRSEPEITLKLKPLMKIGLLIDWLTRSLTDLAEVEQVSGGEEASLGPGRVEDGSSMTLGQDEPAHAQ